MRERVLNPSFIMKSDCHHIHAQWNESMLQIWGGSVYHRL